MSQKHWPVLAGVDCGTNSTRLLIVGSRSEVLLRRAIVTRLGEGVDRKGELDPTAIKRTLNALGEFRHLAEAASVTATRMVATSAVRDANNGQDFLTAAAAIMGTTAELLSGEEEGRLTYYGATSHRILHKEDVAVIDIGGGSTELSAVSGSDVTVISMTIGSVRLTERYLRNDPPLPSEVDAAVNAIRRTIAAIGDHRQKLLQHPSNLTLIGVAGTVTSLAALNEGVESYSPTSIDGKYLSAEDVNRLTAKLLAMPASERARQSPILYGRADVIAAGALILKEIMLSWGASQCIVSEADLLDGLVMSLREDRLLGSMD